jgi:flagellum-specific peptidoglycan hydrolase FlgJ
MDQLVEFSLLDIDLAKTKNNAEAFVAFGNAMANFTGAQPGMLSVLSQGLAAFFKLKPPLTQLEDFSKLEFNTKKVKENGDAVAAFGLAMNALKDVSTQPGVFQAIGESIGKFFGAKPPYDKLEEFSKLTLDVKKVKDNAEAFKAFAEAMGMWRGVGGAYSSSSGSSSVSNPATAGATVSEDIKNKKEDTQSVSNPPSTGASGTPFKGTQKEFHSKMYDSLLKEATKAGVANPEAIARLGAAQSSLETGYGKSHAGDALNYFGIKADKKYIANGGQYTEKMTTEHENGRDVQKVQRFRKYNSMEESAADYIKFLQQNPKYKEVLAAKTAEQAIEAQGKTGYATDPNYVPKIKSIDARRDPEAMKAAATQVEKTVETVKTDPASAKSLAKETGKEVAKASEPINQAHIEAIAEEANKLKTATAGSDGTSKITNAAHAEAAVKAAEEANSSAALEKQRSEGAAETDWMTKGLEARASADPSRSMLNFSGAINGASDMASQQRAAQQQYYAMNGKSHGGNAEPGGHQGGMHTIFGEIKNILSRQTEVAEQHLGHAQDMLGQLDSARGLTQKLVRLTQ